MAFKVYVISMGRLTKAQFLVLTALIKRPMHIYALRYEIIELTGHTYRPRHSSLKRAADALLAAGFIEECSSNPIYWMNAKRGVPYELTAQGRKLVARELAMYFRLCQIGKIWLSSLAEP